MARMTKNAGARIVDDLLRMNPLGLSPALSARHHRFTHRNASNSVISSHDLDSRSRCGVHAPPSFPGPEIAETTLPPYVAAYSLSGAKTHHAVAKGPSTLRAVCERNAPTRSTSDWAARSPTPGRMTDEQRGPRIGKAPRGERSDRASRRRRS